VKPRVLICSFRTPTSACVDLAFMTRLVDFALERELIVCHDFAYADLGSTATNASILQVPRAKECCVELYTLTKSSRWRVARRVPRRQRRDRGGVDEVEELPRLRTFQRSDRGIVAMNEATDYPNTCA